MDKIVFNTYRNKKVLVASYSCNNVSENIRKMQKAVFNHFGWEIYQLTDDIEHWQALDRLATIESDIYFFFDVDCIPIRFGAIEEMISRAVRNRSLVGIEQTCNCNESVGHIYIAPACICFSRETYECLGKPSFRMNSRSDVGQEFTHKAEAIGRKVEAIRLKASKNYKWKLGKDRSFGNGSNYSDMFYHQYEIRSPEQERDFLEECGKVIADANPYVVVNPNAGPEREKSPGLSNIYEEPGGTNLPIHFFTIVLNGEPLIRKHIEAFEKLPFPWHWHVVEGVAALKHDTAWSLANGGRIDETLHDDGLSNDGTSAYLDGLARRFPDRVTIYRKENGAFWDGKLEMVRAPLANIREECLLWQVDADEIWTTGQVVAARDMFLANPERSAAFYVCQFFVGPNLVTTTVNTYGNHLGNEWIRTWRFRPGDEWHAHEPPRLVRRQGGALVDVAAIYPFLHNETVEKGLVFHHYAYAIEEQIRFKEVYYGYRGAVEQWRSLQKAESFPVRLSDYFAWVGDGALVDRYAGETCLDYSPKNILWIRTDAIGDNVLASATLPHIRERYPEAIITVLCQDRLSELYEPSPCVDEIISFNWWRAFHEEPYRQEILASIQAVKADLTLNSVFSREALNDFFAIGSFAPECIAFHGDESNIRPDLRDADNAAYTRIIPNGGVSKPEMERHRDFLRGIGIDAPPLQPMVWTTAEDERFADGFFTEKGLDSRKTVAFYPSGQWAGKFYERYAEALTGVLKENDLSVITFGGGGERDLNSRLIEELGVRGVNVAGETTIRQTAAIIRRCRIGIGADTGTAHIACAVGTPHVVLLWGGHFGRFFPYSQLTSVACLPLECYGCNWKCPYSRPHCVKDIHPSVVETAFRETLGADSDKPRIFAQDYDSWCPVPGEPGWDLFNRFVEMRAVAIVPVCGEKISRMENIS